MVRDAQQAVVDGAAADEDGDSEMDSEMDPDELVENLMDDFPFELEEI